ncbi:hypothetical protein SAMN04487950_4539 [Halogranum rubrum]|uniref:Uncharacterized protein n=1 Tax=Halogranum rubrum TaxID=553466 RepID=A0A1I4JJF5_9EURY|nr:hypothetical protein [Halogranum rubrum]SFL66401.1 hypothetical protein SAMN04487950_4539 [Halogranum rubrum]
MPDENRFAGLGEQMDDEDEVEQVDDNDPPTSDRDAPASTSDPDAGADGGPAFTFEATRAKSIYVRPETLDLLEDVEFEVESILRREHDVRDLTGREFHDALVRAVATDPEAVAKLILDARDD